MRNLQRFANSRCGNGLYMTVYSFNPLSFHIAFDLINNRGKEYKRKEGPAIGKPSPVRLLDMASNSRGEAVYLPILSTILLVWPIAYLLPY